MVNKFLQLAFLLITSVLSVKADYPPPMVTTSGFATYPINATYEEIGAEHVAESLYTKIAAIASQLDIGKIPNVRQPQQKFRTDFPAFEYIVPYAYVGYLFVNQEWFNQLSDDEQTYILAVQLVSIDTYEQSIYNKKIRDILFAVSELAIGACVYKVAPHLIGDNTKLRWGIAVGSALLLELLVEPFAHKKIDKASSNAKLKHIISTFNCKQGALLYLKRMQGEVDQKYKHNKYYWKNLWESIPGLIAYVESL